MTEEKRTSCNQKNSKIYEVLLSTETDFIVNPNRPDSKSENTRILDPLSDGSEGWLLLCHVTISDDKDGARREGGGV